MFRDSNDSLDKCPESTIKKKTKYKTLRGGRCIKNQVELIRWKKLTEIRLLIKCPEYDIIFGTKEVDCVANGFSKQIQGRIGNAVNGTVFVNSDFTDIADAETVRRNLNRLTQAGALRRVVNGVYEKPKYSKLLDEYVATDPDAVARALARSYHWTIAPCGNTALNQLGLSTQVAAVWAYISDGPYRTYEWNTTKLEFKHRANREITGLSYTTSLVVQALKTLGKEHVTPEIIQTLSERLSNEEKRRCLKEAAEAADWVYDAIRRICGGCMQ